MRISCTLLTRWECHLSPSARSIFFNSGPKRIHPLSLQHAHNFQKSTVNSSCVPPSTSFSLRSFLPSRLLAPSSLPTTATQSLVRLSILHRLTFRQNFHSSNWEFFDNQSSTFLPVLVWHAAPPKVPHSDSQKTLGLSIPTIGVLPPITILTIRRT
jgi:hypothetical protein